MRRLTALATASVLVQAFLVAPTARAAEPWTLTFLHTGSEQSFDVPPDVTSIHVVLIGGGEPMGGSQAARVEGDLTVTPGSRLYVEVGGEGGPACGEEFCGKGGFNGGGDGGSGTMLNAKAAGGGGASDLRTLPRTQPASLGSRLIVAAGAGGSGFGGAGGNAHEPGEGEADAGGAGTSSAGGAGGANGGGVGTAGDGGLGGGGFLAGGGGGGGYYGGGGGGTSSVGGGGGGGSSFVGTATNTSVTLAGSVRPSVTVEYESDAPGPRGAVDVTVTMASSVACLILSTGTVDFGTRNFGDVGVAGSPSIEVSSCTSIPETILARGTNAESGDIVWGLVDSGACADETMPLDAFGLTLDRQDEAGTTRLSPFNKTLHTLAPGASAEHMALMDTPCPGSVGAGLEMGMQILFLATEGAG